MARMVTVVHMAELPVCIRNVAHAVQLFPLPIAVHQVSPLLQHVLQMVYALIVVFVDIPILKVLQNSIIHLVLLLHALLLKPAHHVERNWLQNLVTVGMLLHAQHLRLVARAKQQAAQHLDTAG